MSIEIKPLTSALKDDYLYFFDNITFDENPDRHKCYCCDYHFLGDVETCTREISRPFVMDLIGEGKLTGYLVFDNDRPVGWCNANNRANYQRLLRDYDYVDNPDHKVCSILCFLIHPNYRRQGIAQQLLEKVIQDCTGTDYDFIEAYPRKNASSGEENFKGPLELYLRNGFEVYGGDEKHIVVRRDLNGYFRGQDPRCCPQSH